MSDDLQRATRDYYTSDSIDEWLDYVYPAGGTAHFPFGHARALVIGAALDGNPVAQGTGYDIGCGAGQLAVLLARRGFRVRAVDFSAPMLSRAAANARSAGVADRVAIVEADFLEADVVRGERGSLAIAMGVLEYCPDPARFFARLRACLTEGGLAVVEFRNRLLSATSANAYTVAELDAGGLPGLIDETAEAWGEHAPSADDVTAYARAMSAVRIERSDPAGSSVAPFPADRLQHTFRQMAELGDAAGLELIELLALHPHPFPPVVERAAPYAYNAVAWALQQLPRNPLVLMTSSSAAAVYRSAK